MGADREPYERVVAQFRSDLDFAALRPVAIMPELIDYVRHDGEVSTPDVSNYRDGIYVIEESEVMRTGYMHFVPRIGRRIGREMSHNNVLFGDLRYEAEEQSTVVELAVKPCESGRLPELVGEMAMSAYMRSLGIAAFEPYGLVLHSNRGYMLTGFEGPVTTLDTMDWKKMEPEEAWAEAHLATDTLALFHSNMLFHGDADFRNIAQNALGEPRAVDPEYTKSAKDIYLRTQEDPFGEEGARALGKIVRLMSTDLTDVSKSAQSLIVNQNLTGNRQPSSAQLLKCYKRNLFTQYLNQLHFIDAPTLPVLEKVFHRVLSMKRKLAAKGAI